MTEFEKKHLDLIERQLIEKIEERTERNLICVYSKVFIIAIILIGIVVFALVEWASIRLQNNIVKKIEVINTELARTNTYITITNDSLEKDQETVRTDTKPTAEKPEKRLNSIDPSLDTLEKVNNRSKEINLMYSNKIIPLIEKMNLSELRLREDPAGNFDVNKEVLKEQIDTPKANFNKLEKKTTVYFQFAGSTREQAKEILEKLKTSNYIVPEEDHEDNVTGRYEVRYFYDSDKVAANQLASDVTQAIRDLGYTEEDIPDIDSNNLTTLEKTKPKEGVLELWLYIPKK